ncbi:MAG: response regulator [Syntrophobacteraceae bacterium]
MKERRHSVTILMADDDQDDCLLIRDAFAENRLPDVLRFVENGEALMDYLYQRGAFADPELSPRPELILLDLNMPRMDGREALRIIKSDPELRDIPVVVLTTSRYEVDVACSYSTGANSFITKPDTFDGLLWLVRNLIEYWFKAVKLPAR